MCYAREDNLFPWPFSSPRGHRGLRVEAIRRPGFLFLAGLILACRWASQVPASSAPPTSPPPAAAPAAATSEGAWIELYVPDADPELWTVVQWQDARGGWHDVEGWQGTLDDRKKRWWVAPGHFGNGPFRWVLLRERGGPPLATSQTFNLPGNALDVLGIELRVRR